MKKENLDTRHESHWSYVYGSSPGLYGDSTKDIRSVRHLLLINSQMSQQLRKHHAIIRTSFTDQTTVGPQRKGLEGVEGVLQKLIERPPQSAGNSKNAVSDLLSTILARILIDCHKYSICRQITYCIPSIYTYTYPSFCLLLLQFRNLSDFIVLSLYFTLTPTLPIFNQTLQRSLTSSI